MTRTVGSLAGLAAVTALLALAPGAAAKTCAVKGQQSYPTTYVYKITASGTSCRSARELVRAYHRCRPGRKGKCPRVRRYRCSENRFNKSSISYDSRVKCTRGGKTVRHTYTQNI